MRLHSRIVALISKGIIVAILLAFSGALIAFVNRDSSTRPTMPAQDKLDATILSYDGKDFVRTQTTMVTEDGKSAVNTKLDHNSPAYEALLKKHSYTGEATVFGRRYEANYAPLTSDGRLTGALFVGVPKTPS